MSLYKQTGSRFWWYSFVFKGQRVQRSTKVENRREAENIEKAAWTQLARGEVGIEEKPKPKLRTIGELLDNLKADYELRGKGTAPNLSLIGIVKKEFGTRNSERFTGEDAAQYITRKRKEGRADSTISNHLQILSQAFTLAKLTAPDIPHLSTDNARSGFFNREEFDRVCSRLPEDLRDFCLFGYLTGWRKAAIATLEWSDIRDGNVYLRGKRSKNGKPYFVPMMGELKLLMSRREAVRAISNRSAGVVLCSFVFHRGGLAVNGFRKSWDTACVAAGLGKMLCERCESEGPEKRCPKCKTARKYKGRIFHDLRRSAARNLIRAGVNQAVAMKITGHETDAMFRRYNITSEDDLRDAMQKVANYDQAGRQNVVAIAESR